MTDYEYYVLGEKLITYLKVMKKLEEGYLISLSKTMLKEAQKRKDDPMHESIMHWIICNSNWHKSSIQAEFGQYRITD